MDHAHEPTGGDGDASPGVRYETTEEVAARVRRHPKTIDTYARKGILPSYQFLPGGPRLFVPGEVDAALRALRVASKDVPPRVDGHAPRRLKRTPAPIDFDVRRIGRDDGQAAS